MDRANMYQPRFYRSPASNRTKKEIKKKMDISLRQKVYFAFLFFDR